MRRPLIDLFESRRSQHSDVREAQRETAVLAEKLLRTGEAEPDDISIRDCWNVFVMPLIEASGKDFSNDWSDYDTVREEVVSSQFPFITGKLIHPMLMRQYEMDIADIMPLVTEVESDHREEDVAGTTAGDSARYTEEGMPYPESGLGEKRVNIRNFKFGHGLALTVEMVRFNQTGELQRRARNVGTFIADTLETFIVYRVTDTAWSEIKEATSQAFVLDGTRRAVFADTHASYDVYANDNLVGSGSGGTPNRAQVKTMLNLLKGMKDLKNKPVRVRPRIVFGHTQLEEDFNQFFNLQQFDLNSAERDQNPYRGRFQIVTSQFAPDTAEWFIGDFARALRLQWVWRPRTVVDRSGDPKRDILVAYYSNMFCGVGYEDYRFVVRNHGS